MTPHSNTLYHNAESKPRNFSLQSASIGTMDNMLERVNIKY